MSWGPISPLGSMAGIGGAGSPVGSHMGAASPVASSSCRKPSGVQESPPRISVLTPRTKRDSCTSAGSSTPSRSFPGERLYEESKQRACRQQDMRAAAIEAELSLQLHAPRPGMDAASVEASVVQRLYRTEMEKRRRKEEEAQQEEARRTAEAEEDHRRKLEQARPGTYKRLYLDYKSRDEGLLRRRQEQETEEARLIAEQSVHKGATSDGSVFLRLYSAARASSPTPVSTSASLAEASGSPFGGAAKFAADLRGDASAVGGNCGLVSSSAGGAISPRWPHLRGAATPHRLCSGQRSGKAPSGASSPPPPSSSGSVDAKEADCTQGKNDMLAPCFTAEGGPSIAVSGVAEDTDIWGVGDASNCDESSEVVSLGTANAYSVIVEPALGTYGRDCSYSSYSSCVVTTQRSPVGSNYTSANYASAVLMPVTSPVSSSASSRPRPVVSWRQGSASPPPSRIGSTGRGEVKEAWSPRHQAGGHVPVSRRFSAPSAAAPRAAAVARSAAPVRSLLPQSRSGAWEAPTERNPDVRLSRVEEPVEESDGESEGGSSSASSSASEEASRATASAATLSTFTTSAATLATVVAPPEGAKLEEAQEDDVEEPWLQI